MAAMHGYESASPSSSADPGASRDFGPSDRVLPRILRRQAERFGDRCLLRAGATAWSFADAPALAAGRAAQLAAAGVTPGDRVAILSGNRPEFLEVFLGCAWLGAVAVPINTAARGPQLAHVLADSGARLIVVEAALAGVLEAVAAAPGIRLETAWVIGDGALPLRGIARSRPLPDFAATEAVPHEARPGDILTILYTSGTTGVSKGVASPHAHCFWWGANSADILGVGEGDVLWTALPLFHINALNTFYQALLTGATLVLASRFSASGFWPAVAEADATVSYLLGAMVPILLSRPPGPEDRNHRLRTVLSPAVPEVFLDQFRARFGVAVVDGYGSTETNFVIGDRAADRVPGYMGRLRPGFSARVVDGDENPVPDGEPGELVLRADEPYAFAAGYHGMAGATVEAWRNLWFHTGDRVVREAGGLYRFVDRLKDVIRRRGENISALEVEAAIASHPAVADVAVFPVPSDLAEDEVMAAVVLRDGAVLAADALLDHCRTRLAYFALPRYVDFVPALPTTENGKVQKFRLRESGVTATTWDREAAGYVVRR
jgi:crotonobetaine/carnitine-CoA ligase